MALGVLLSGLILAGCTSSPPKDPKPEGGFSSETNGQPTNVAVNSGTNQLGTSTNITEIDLIRVGSGLTITFADINPLPTPFVDTVRNDGTIKLLMDHIFKAAGKNRGELEKEIHDYYVPGFYKYMTVTVKLQDQYYSVGGEVKAGNRFQWIGPTTVSRAIQSAGDFTDWARRRMVRLTHANGATQIVDCIEARKNQTLDPQVLPGDSIDVPRKRWPWQE